MNQANISFCGTIHHLYVAKCESVHYND